MDLLPFNHTAAHFNIKLSRPIPQRIAVLATTTTLALVLI